MHETFDAFEYIEFLRGRWRLIGAACGAALIVSLGISLLLPKRYTATASIMINPPGGGDTRTATAVSPVYLESLKTFERFAASDTLFERAAGRFHLQGAPATQSVESLKRRILKVSKLRDTKILEISVTLTNPRIAQNLAEYLAKETVSLSRDESSASDHDLVDDAGKQVEETRASLERLRAAWSAMSAKEPIEALQSEIDTSTQVLSSVREQQVGAEADLAGHDRTSNAAEESELRTARARALFLKGQVTELEKTIAAQSRTLAERTARKNAMQADLKAAQTAADDAAARLRELRAVSGSHGERLRIIDPGIVPQQSSYPNIPVNVLSAVMFALVSSMVYLTAAFAFRTRSEARQRDTARRAFSR